MRRVISVLTVMAIVAAMLMTNTLPAFAAANEDKSSCRGDVVSDSVTDPLNPGGPLHRKVWIWKWDLHSG